MLDAEQTEQVRAALEEAERRLVTSAHDALEISRERAMDQGRDSIDQSNSEQLLSSALRLRDREQKLLNKIRSAIDRLEHGTIDECEECGEEIGFKRLLARPVTTLCISCKESAEERERQFTDDDAGPRS